MVLTPFRRAIRIAERFRKCVVVAHVVKFLISHFLTSAWTRVAARAFFDDLAFLVLDVAFESAATFVILEGELELGEPLSQRGPWIYP